VESNIPVTIHSSAGEVIFNVLEGDGTAVAADLRPGSLAGLSDVVAPVGLPDGNGYHVTFIGGNDGAAFRHGVQLVQNMLHLQSALLLILQRILFLITVQVLDPIRSVKLRDMFYEFLENEPCIADAPSPLSP